MISYYLWFASFGYCDDEKISSHTCCKNEILKNWQLIEHKEYSRKLPQEIFNIIKNFNLNNKLNISSDKNEDYYLYNFAILKSDNYKKFVFCFPGTTGLIQLFDEILLSKMVSYFNDKEIKVEQYFYEIFQLIYNDVFSSKIIQDIKSNPSYQIIFIGHSLGGAMATLLSYYYAKELKEFISSNEPVLITFGQPRVGNINFSKNYMKLIHKVFRIVREEDLIPRIPLIKEQNLKLNDILKLFSNGFIKQNDVILSGLNSFLINQLGYMLIKKFNLADFGYCHIGGLYLLKDKKFYHCFDFYNEETGHPICRNIDLSDIKQKDKILEYHGYLDLGEDVMKKCQKDKTFNIIKKFKN